MLKHRLSRTNWLIVVIALSAAISPEVRAGEGTATAPADVPQGIIEASDPAGGPLRAAARAFLKHLATGDGKAAHEMFDGPKDQAELLDACLAAAKASARFGKSIRARFPDDEVSKRADLDDPLNFEGQLHAIEAATFIRDADTASMWPGTNPINNGLDFKFVDGHWKVTHLVSLHEQTPSHLAFAKAFVEVLDHGSTKVDHGDYAKAKDAVRAVTEKLLPLYETERTADHAGQTKRDEGEEGDGSH